MDEESERLRDIFMDVAEDGTVTESQSETRGSLLDDGDEEAKLINVIETMRDRCEFDTDLDVDTYAEIVSVVYSDAARSDEAIAAEIDPDLDPTTVTRARFDLHLWQDGDVDPAIDLATVRQRRDTDTTADADAATLAAEFDVTPGAVERAHEVIDAQNEARRANYRYRERFEEILTDAELDGTLTDHVTEDGLEEAAEDIETDVSF